MDKTLWLIFWVTMYLGGVCIKLCTQFVSRCSYRA